ARVLKPQVIVEHREDLRGEKPALGEKMAGALAAYRDFGGKLGTKDDQSFGVHCAVLDETEAHCVDSGVPGQVGEAVAGACDGICDPRAIEVKGEATLSCERAEFRNVRSAVDQAIFGRVGDRKRGRL